MTVSHPAATVQTMTRRWTGAVVRARWQALTRRDRLSLVAMLILIISSTAMVMVPRTRTAGSGVIFVVCVIQLAGLVDFLWRGKTFDGRTRWADRGMAVVLIAGGVWLFSDFIVDWPLLVPYRLPAVIVVAGCIGLWLAYQTIDTASSRRRFEAELASMCQAAAAPDDAESGGQP